MRTRAYRLIWPLFSKVIVCCYILLINYQNSNNSNNNNHNNCLLINELIKCLHWLITVVKFAFRFSVLSNARPAAQQWRGWPHPAWHVPPCLLLPLPCAPTLPPGWAERSSTRPPGSIQWGQATPPTVALPRPHSVSSTPAWRPRFNGVNILYLSPDS